MCDRIRVTAFGEVRKCLLASYLAFIHTKNNFKTIKFEIQKVYSTYLKLGPVNRIDITFKIRRSRDLGDH